MEEFTQDQILEFLHDLTKRRRAGVHNGLLDDIREEMYPDLPKKIRMQQLMKREGELEELLPKWYVVWYEADKKYGIIPRREA